jgi:cyclophilin family peptidyl-prolyl cis-trans isomerase
VSKSSKRERQRMNREARREYELALARRRRMFKTARTLAIFVVPVLAVGIFLSVSGGDDAPSAAEKAGCRDVKKPKPKGTTFEAVPPLTIDATKTYAATVDTSCGSFTIQLAAGEAPQTVNSFAFLSEEGFYDNLMFHRVQKDFVVQGGDPSGDGSGGPGYTLPDEPPALGYQKGSVAMANSGPATTGSQFYIVTTQDGADALNAQINEAGKFSYSILGQVTDGFETIEKMNKLGSTNQDPAQQAPKFVIVIDKITINEQPADATTTTT